MSLKTHLARDDGYPTCARRCLFQRARVLPVERFVVVPEAERCTHCQDKFLLDAIPEEGR